MAVGNWNLLNINMEETRQCSLTAAVKKDGSAIYDGGTQEWENFSFR